MITPRSRIATGMFVTVFLLLLATHPVQAAGPSVRVRSSVVRPDGSVQAVVAVSGLPAGKGLRASDFAVTDTGGTVSDLTVKNLATAGVQALSVALVIDTSGSTAGRPIADARAAADGFLAGLPKGTTVSVISFGATVKLLRAPSTDVAGARAVLRSLNASGNTALYDALVFGARVLGRTKGQRNLVLFSDGKDTASRATAREGTTALRTAKASTTVVGLRTGDYDGKTLAAVAKATAGSVVEVAGSAALAGAFATVARDLSSQYELTYSAARTAVKAFELRVALTAFASAADTVTLLTPATAIVREPLPPLPRARGPIVPALSAPVGVGVGLAAAFLAMLLLLAPILVPSPDRSARKLLRRALGRPTSKEPERRRELDGVIQSSLGRAAVELAEKMPKRAAHERLQFALVRSGWPLRAAEFRVIQTTATLAAFLLGFGLGRTWWYGAVLALVGAAIPRVLLARRIERRTKAFLRQLPQALDILASSLQAGLSFMQALDGLMRELNEPASVEFGRVLSEARLGMALEDSLEAAAARVGSEDFTWVVMAIAIQRRAGGNLAQLMRTVAATLRERDQVRAQIRVLSSEGRLSAVILIALPFVLSGYIQLVNPGYIGKLFEVRMGQYMVMGALTLMGVGVVWMRKVIRVDI